VANNPAEPRARSGAANEMVTAGLQEDDAGTDGRGSRLRFFSNVLAFSKQIRGTVDTDQFLHDVAGDVCALFECESLVLYGISEDHGSIVSCHNSVAGGAKPLVLPISENSAAGYVALRRRVLCIRDVYDEAELASHAPPLRFSRELDLRSGQRTRQMLVAPVLDTSGNTLLGVLQLANQRRGRCFRSIAAEALRELCAALAIALRRRLTPPPKPLTKYDCLVADAVLSAADLARANRAANAGGSDIERVLMKDYKVKLAELGAALARFYGVPYEPFRPERNKPSGLLKSLRREFVEHNKWLLLHHHRDLVVILALEPDKLKQSNMINNVFPKARLVFRVTTNLEFALTVDKFFGGPADSVPVSALLASMKQTGAEASGDDNDLVRLVNKIILDAHHQGASDIHIEPGIGDDNTLIRFRKDGALEPYVEVPASYRSALLARIKIMCDLDTSEHRKPQDGKIRFDKYGQADIELRVLTIPSAGGVEDVVLRILTAGEPIPLDQLGVLPHNLARLKQVIANPHGLFFVCGPTGSGKTTTLHSVLRHLNTPETKIWTAEDPVEITQKGLRQVQVNRKTGLDFATVMRSFLRADPDIIMVGEMRDKETVSIVLEASLTGHLVFATLHTNSAAESIVRLLDMGMDPFNCADALLGVLAQRLARRLCVHCRKAYVASQQEIDALLAEYCAQMQSGEGKQQVRTRWMGEYADGAANITLYQPVGCGMCNKGYKGRIGLHELMVATPKIKRMLQERARVSDLLAAALGDGMATLKMDGIEKVLSGATDMKQVRLVCIS
jgi:type II secretory ATPase GspE/PulE/Tfp pilus assembly ATPase PilB-like protein